MVNQKIKKMKLKQWSKMNQLKYLNKKKKI